MALSDLPMWGDSPTMTAAQIPLADVSDMVGIHQVFRDALGAAPTLIAPVAEGDKARAVYVGSYYENVLNLLHVHHDGEDQFMTPKLLERAPDQAALIASIAGQHGNVLDGIAEVERLLVVWQADPSATSRSALVDAVDRLGVELSEHLDDEERVILPVAAKHINAAEWGELPGHGLRHFGGDKIWLVLGLIQEQMTPEQVTTMEEHMPPELVEFWRESGRSLFRDYIAELRSPLHS